MTKIKNIVRARLLIVDEAISATAPLLGAVWVADEVVRSVRLERADDIISRAPHRNVPSEDSRGADGPSPLA